MTKVTEVAAAVIERPGEFLLAQRPEGKPYPGYWEFPGGKIEAGEDARSALARELREELGIELVSARPFMRLAHAYEDRDVTLSLWIIEHFAGVPRSLDRQRLKWVAPASLPEEDILEADRPFIEALQSLPAPR